MEYCSSGILCLDEVLGGGFPKPSLILIAGTAGVGKTTMVIQSLSRAAENGERAVYIPITSHSTEKTMDYLNSYPFFNENVMVHPINRSTAEKDPLTTLLDIGNILTSTDPQRLVVNPLTTLGYGFPVQERRRFFYSLDDMLQDRPALTMVTGELSWEQIHDSIITHIADGVIYLDRRNVGTRNVRKMEIMKMRGLSTKDNNLSSRYEFKICSEGINIFPRLKSVDCPGPMNGHKLSTGVEGLDAMMKGGIPCHSTVLAVGGPGVGKTLLGLQYIFAGLERDEPGLIVLFEEREEQLIYEASRLGWDLKEFIEQGRLGIMYSNPQNISPDEHNLNIKQYVDDLNAKRLFFDSVYDLISVIPDPIDLKNHIRLLSDYLKSRGVTTLFTSEVSDLFSPGSAQGISSIADAIIMLHFLDKQKRLDRAISVLKLRGSDHDKNVRKYAINEKGIEIIQKGFKI